MKNLANCKPREFITQTNRIRKTASKWLADTDILNIRMQMPDIPDDASDEEKAKAMKEQAKKNLNLMLNAILDDYPEETLELLALSCFVEPKDVDDYPMTDYLDSIQELISNASVLNFFTSLVQLANRLT